MRKLFATALVKQIEYTLGEKNKRLIASYHEADCDVRKNVKPFESYYMSILNTELPLELYWLIEESTKTKYCKSKMYDEKLSVEEYDEMYKRFGLSLDFNFNYDNNNGVSKVISLKEYLYTAVDKILNSDEFVERKVESMKIEMLTLNQVFYKAFTERMKVIDAPLK